MATSLSRPFVNAPDIGNTMSYDEYHHFVTSLEPIPSDWYLSSSAQRAGWFHSPMYFVDGGKDGIQHVFCWSLSVYKGGDINYLWRVYWNFHSEPILALCQRFQALGSPTFATDGYLFHTQSPDCRAMWREIKPPTIFSPSLADVALHTTIHLNWFGSSSLGSNINPPTQPSVPALPGYTYQTTDDLAQSGSDLYVSPADTFFSFAPTPSSQPSDTSSDVSVDACNPGDSEAEQATQDPRAYFYTDEQGKITLDVPCSLKDRDAVKLFLGKALEDLGKNARQVKCSLCKNKKANKEWHVKPSNLERHILAHLGIKDNQCPECGEAFTTKDQMSKHIQKKHPGLAKRLKLNGQDGGSLETMNGDLAQGTYATSSSGIGRPVGGMEPLNNQTLQAQYMVPGFLNNNHDFNCYID
ncbi:hypothetical protein RSAG8_07765, partial [Rhizoctonia solani AG-8 WAC10335]